MAKRKVITAYKIVCVCSLSRNKTCRHELTNVLHCGHVTNVRQFYWLDVGLT